MDDSTFVIAPDKIVMRDINELHPYGNNSRIHTASQITEIANSIREFGFTNPVLIGKDDTIVAGHGRVLASAEVGMPQVPTISLEHLTTEQVRAYVIADNKLAENASWDHDMLAEEMGWLKEQDFDLTLLGFSGVDIDHILDGWSSDIAGVTDIEESDLEADAVIKLVCTAGNREPLMEWLKQALENCPVEGVELAS